MTNIKFLFLIGENWDCQSHHGDCLRLLEVTKGDFKKIIKDKDFIGKMYARDFQYLVHQIELIHED